MAQNCQDILTADVPSITAGSYDPGAVSCGNTQSIQSWLQWLDTRFSLIACILQEAYDVEVTLPAVAGFDLTLPGFNLPGYEPFQTNRDTRRRRYTHTEWVGNRFPFHVHAPGVNTAWRITGGPSITVPDSRITIPGVPDMKVVMDAINVNFQLVWDVLPGAVQEQVSVIPLPTFPCPPDGPGDLPTVVEEANKLLEDIISGLANNVNPGCSPTSPMPPTFDIDACVLFQQFGEVSSTSRVLYTLTATVGTGGIEYTSPGPAHNPAAPGTPGGYGAVSLFTGPVVSGVPEYGTGVCWIAPIGDCRRVDFGATVANSLVDDPGGRGGEPTSLSGAFSHIPGASSISLAAVGFKADLSFNETNFIATYDQGVASIEKLANEGAQNFTDLTNGQIPAPALDTFYYFLVATMGISASTYIETYTPSDEPLNPYDHQHRFKTRNSGSITLNYMSLHS